MERFTLRTARALALGSMLASFVAVGTGATAYGAEPVAQPVHCRIDINLEKELNVPVYQWKASEQPRGVVLALHGLVLHGMSYDGLGKTLAEDGYVVYATDMRGYGRLTKQYPHEFCTDHDCKQKIDYTKSSDDIAKLADRLRAAHPGIPFFIVGESLGAHMALRVASKNPDAIDGLVLSAPAIKAHTFFDAHAAVAMSEVMTLTNVHKKVNILPYVKRYASNDPEIVEELVTDPLMRKNLTIKELIQSKAAVYKTMSFVPGIHKPVLVIQGTEDKCVRADAVKLLTEKLHAETQVKMFDHRGHILIETAHIKPDTMSTLTTWLHKHDAGTGAGLHATTSVNAEVLATEDVNSQKDQQKQ